MQREADAFLARHLAGQNPDGGRGILERKVMRLQSRQIVAIFV
jgi:hypothetical protein